MTEYIPLDHLILNLLALAEAAEELPPEARAQLARLAEEVEPDVDALARVSVRLHTALLDQPAFTAARAAWDNLRPERYGLNVETIKEDLTNPEIRRSQEVQELGLEPGLLEGLAIITRDALQDSQRFRNRQGLLRMLAGWVGLRWPRE